MCTMRFRRYALTSLRVARRASAEVTVYRVKMVVNKGGDEAYDGRLLCRR